MNQNITCPAGKFIVPEHFMLQNCMHIGQLISMHLNLIELYEEESRLKKHHKPYLHIRSYAEEICQEDKYLMMQILAQYDSPQFRDCITACAEKQVTERQMAAPAAGKKKEGSADEQGQSEPEKADGKKERSMQEQKLHDFTAFDTVLCKGCKDYGSCFEKKLAALSGEIEKKEAAQPDCETVREKKENEKDAPEEDDSKMILMTADTLGTMQNDVISMLDEIDHLAGALEKVASGQKVQEECIRQLLQNASRMAEEIFQRWDSADLEKVS